MPIYEYTCEKCQTKVDVLQKMDDPPPAKCDSCGELGAMARMVSRTSFVLKGGGWYSDLYGSSKKESSSTPAAPAAKAAETPAKKDSGSSGGSGTSGGSGGSTPSSGGTPPASGGTSGSSAAPAA